MRLLEPAGGPQRSPVMKTMRDAMQTRRDGGPRTRAVDLGLRVAGAGLLTATAAMHLDLYLTGFRNIPTIGGLFLLQIIAAFALALAVLATGHWLAAAA